MCTIDELTAALCRADLSYERLGDTFTIRGGYVDASVPFFFKQWGEWVSVSEQAGPGAHHHFDDGATVRRVGKKAAGRLLDGVEHNAMPEVSHD